MHHAREFAFKDFPAMPHRFICLVILALSALFSVSARCAEQPIQFSIAESDPFLSGPIGLNDVLYIRLAYKSDQPVRFRMEAFAAGKKIITGVSYNPAPPYPSGDGEALVWLAFRQPVTIDEIRIKAADEQWKTIGTLRAPVALEWNASTTKHIRADWANRLSSEQQDNTGRQMQQANQGGDWIGDLIIPLGGISILGYLMLQPWLIWRLRGGWRTTALLPLIAVVPLFGHAAFALAAGSNLWPLGLIFFMPIAFFYLVVLSGIKWLVG
jgi:hypothetical protein